MRAFLLALIFAFTACAVQPETGPSPADSPTTASDQVCGGMMAGPGQSCSGENEYCHRNVADMCGAADAPGTCRPKPEACTMDYSPVCGCDGVTYPNECAANAKGISAASLGECK